MRHPIPDTELEEIVARSEREQKRRTELYEKYSRRDLSAEEFGELSDMARWGQLNIVRLVDEIRDARKRLDLAPRYMEVLKEYLLHEHNQLLESAGRLPKPQGTKEIVISQLGEIRDKMLGRLELTEDTEKVRLLAVIKARTIDVEHRDDEIKRIRAKLEIAESKVSQREDAEVDALAAKLQALDEVSRLRKKVNKLVRRLRFLRHRHDADRAVWMSLITMCTAGSNEKIRGLVQELIKGFRT